MYYEMHPAESNQFLQNGASLLLLTAHLLAVDGDTTDSCGYVVSVVGDTMDVYHPCDTFSTVLGDRSRY